jgi:hypothetical protein
MTLPGFARPLVEDGSSPFLLWSDDGISGRSAAVACPQCAGANLHLDTVHIATPTRDHYTPTVGLSINPTTGAVTADDTARALHAGANRGAMLSIGYWCELGCQGRIELRAHKGRLFGSLHHEPPFQLDNEPTH